MKWWKNCIIGLIVIISLLIININVIASNAPCNTDNDCSQFKPLYYIICGSPPSPSIGIKCINNECVLGCYDKHETEYVNLTPSYPEEEVKIVYATTDTDEETTLETPTISPMKVESSISKAPALNDITIITTVITYTGGNTDNIPKTTAQIILPNGFELVSGNLTWEGYVKNEPQQFSVVVKAIKEGNWTIEANVRSPPTGREHIGGRDWIYISVYKDKGVIQEGEFLLPEEEGMQLLTKLNESDIPPEKEIYNKSGVTPKPTEFIPDNKTSSIKGIFVNIINFFKNLFN